MSRDRHFRRASELAPTSTASEAVKQTPDVKPLTVIHAVPRVPAPVPSAPLHERLASAVREAERANSPDAQPLNAILVPLAEAIHKAAQALVVGDVAKALVAEIARI